MKVYGIVKYFDKHLGLIRGVDGEDYVLKKYEIKNNSEDLKKGDYVVFIREKYNSVETSINIARNIIKIDKLEYPRVEYKTRRH